MGRSRGGGGGGGGGRGSGPPGKSQVAIGILRNTSIDPPQEAIGSLPQEAIGSLGSNCFSKEVHTAHCEIH